MISRILSTLFLGGLAVGALFSELTWARPSDDHVFIVFAVLAAAVAAANWFLWETIREGWNSGRTADREGARLPSLAWSWPLYINAIFNVLRPGDPRRPGSDQRRGMG
jgi:hypothetical protein